MRALKAISARQRGFTLIELMVGLVIGLLTVLVITQVMALAEGKKRTVSMGGDAQVNGALALFSIQRDIQQSGYGAAADPDALGCTVNYQFGSSGTPGTFTLAPVRITDGGAATASDTIAILQANPTNFSAPMLLTGVANQSDNHFTVTSSFGGVAGNLMLAVPQAWNTTQGCGLFSITTDGVSPATLTTLSATNVPHVTGSSGPSQWNTSSALPATAMPAGSYLLNLGAMLYRTYSVSSTGNLQGADLSSTDGSKTAQDLFPQIVMMQAMYGRDTNSDGKIDTYDKANPLSTDSAAQANAKWKQVLAIRIAIVARSNQYEKDVVTSSAPLWDIGSTIAVTGTVNCNNGSQCLKLDVSTLADWQHYRYKVYDTIVPLRNMLWNN